MVDQKKPAKPVPATADTKPAATSTTARPPLPSLSPLPGEKSAAAEVQPSAPAATTATPVDTTKPASAPAEVTAAPATDTASKPVNTEAKPTTAPALTSKPIEKLGPKLRRKDEILNALRAGGKVEKIDGLFRIVNLDGTKNATSKRRILSLENQKLLVASADGKSYTLDAAADKKAREPKPVAAAKPATEEKK